MTSLRTILSGPLIARVKYPDGWRSWEPTNMLKAKTEENMVSTYY